MIAAVAALAGTVVGGGATYLGNEQLQNRQVAREEDRQTTAARAVARVLIGEYEHQERRVGEMVALEKYVAANYRQKTFVSKIGLDDRKLLAAHLSATGWKAVSEASRYVEEVDATLEENHGVGPVHGGALEFLEAAETACAKGYKALEQFAK